MALWDAQQKTERELEMQKAVALALEIMQKQQGQKLERLEAAIGPREGWYTAAGMARVVGISTPTDMNTLGRLAASVTREKGITPDRISDARYGYVNSLPEQIWLEALRLFLRDRNLDSDLSLRISKLLSGRSEGGDADDDDGENKPN